MTREEIIIKLNAYFSIKELIDKETYKLLKEHAWFLFDTDTLHSLLIQREIVNTPFTINNWSYKHSGPTFTQRGWRSNLSSIVSSKTKSNSIYSSGHVLGKAFDYTAKGLTAEEVRNIIITNQERLPYKIRLEHIDTRTGLPITWVHFDTKYFNNNKKVYLFNV